MKRWQLIVCMMMTRIALGAERARPRRAAPTGRPAVIPVLATLRGRACRCSVSSQIWYKVSACQLVTLSLFLLLLAGCTNAASPPALSTLTGALVIHAPEAVQAGTAIRVRIERADAGPGLAVTLVAQGSYGVRVYRGAFAEGAAELLLPGADVQSAGLVTLIATAGEAHGEADVEIQPGPPIDPVTPLVGGRSIIADRKHWSMVVAVPFDAYGNPVADGTAVEVRWLHPDSRLETTTIHTNHLIAWQRLFSGPQAGRSVVSVTAQGAHGPEATVQEVPGWPAPFTISASPPTLPADGHRFVTLRTAVIRDLFGNPMLDGTAVTFVVETPTGQSSSIPALTIDGVAEAQLQAATTPGVLAVRATVYGVESQPFSITFTAGPAVGTIPVTAHVNTADGFVALDAGPLLGTLDQFVPDGTTVRFQVTNPDRTTQSLAAEAVAGYAHTELRLASLSPGAYTVEVFVGTGRGQAAFRVS